MGKALFYKNGNQKIDLKEGENCFGRKCQGNFQIRDEQISSKHFQIDVIGDLAVLIDLNSKNGTYCNGKKISAKVVLNNQDEITAGDHLYIYLVDANDTATISSITSVSNTTKFPPAEFRPVPKDEKPIPPIFEKPEKEDIDVDSLLEVNKEIRGHEVEIEHLKKKKKIIQERFELKTRLLKTKQEILSRVGDGFDTMIVKNIQQEKSVQEEIVKLKERVEKLEWQLKLFTEKQKYDANEDQLFEHLNKDYQTELVEIDDKIGVCYKKIDFLTTSEAANTLKAKEELEKQMREVNAKLKALSTKK